MKIATKMYLVMILMMAGIMVYQYQQLKTGFTSMQWTGAKNVTSNTIESNEVCVLLIILYCCVVGFFSFMWVKEDWCFSKSFDTFSWFFP